MAGFSLLIIKNFIKKAVLKRFAVFTAKYLCAFILIYQQE